MKLSLWTRAKGKFAVMQMIAFFEWSAFLSWFFWAQVLSISSEVLMTLLTVRHNTDLL